MENRKSEFDKERWLKTKSQEIQKNELTQAIVNYLDNRLASGRFHALIKAFAKALGKNPFSTDELDDFLTPKVEETLALLTDEQYAKDFRGVAELLMEGQFSLTAWRRSYRTNRFYYHAGAILRMVCHYVKSYYYKETVKELLYCNCDDPGYESDSVSYAFPYRLAVELKNGNAEIIELVRESIYGDNTQIPLSRSIIEAIVLSGRDDLVDDLLKLLDAAKLQEGLRQNILESADLGSVNTLRKILKFCVDNDMFRFSSFVRALDVWTGLSFSAARPSVVSKAARLACEALEDPSGVQKNLESEDALECYFALWGAGCREITDVERLAETLLTDPRRYKRLLGWYLIKNSDNELFSTRIALKHLDERDDEILCWIVLSIQTRDLYEEHDELDLDWDKKKKRQFTDKRREYFESFKEIAKHFGNRKLQFSGSPFPWASIEGSAEFVIDDMFYLANQEPEYLKEILEVAKWASNDNVWRMTYSLPSPQNDDEIADFLFQLLDGRSVFVKKEILDKLSRCKLNAEHIDKLCADLRSKSGSYRQKLVSTLTAQTKSALLPAVAKLLSSKNDNQLQAGLEILLELEEKKKSLLEENRGALEALRNKTLSTQTEILLKRLFPDQSQEDDKEEEIKYTRANGFGFYCPETLEAFVKSFCPARLGNGVQRLEDERFGKNGSERADLFTEEQIKETRVSEEELDRLFTRLDAIFTKHANYEFTIEQGIDFPKQVLFGDNNPLIPKETGFRTLDEEGASPEMIPFWEEFADAFGDYLTDPRKYIGLYYPASAYKSKTYTHGTPTPWHEEFAKKELEPDLSKIEAKYNRASTFYYIIKALRKLYDPHQLYDVALKTYHSLLTLVGKENLYAKQYVGDDRGDPSHESGEFKTPLSILAGLKGTDAVSAYAINLRIVQSLRSLINSLPLSDADFTEWFSFEYRFELPFWDKVKEKFKVEALYRACDLGLLSRDVFTSVLAKMEHRPYGSRTGFTELEIAAFSKEHWRANTCASQYAWGREIANQLSDRIVDVETRRGELTTEASSLCLNLARVEGVRNFSKILAALGKEKFFRSCEYGWNYTKQSVLSRLLKICYPSKGDASENLAEAFRGTDIDAERLVEAAMYAPQWAGIVEQYVGWQGLQSGIRYFHAHVNEEFSAEKETETARYSSIAPEQFNDGVFDRNWFFDAYEQLGEARFQTLYRFAKYITNGSNKHKRSQLFSDAALGKLDAEELRQEIVEKRNQDKLRSYAAIPIKPGDAQETLRRYEFIQQFLKESKQYGALRRESEKKASLSALHNLAITAGYPDVNRLTWQMESVKSDSLKPLFEPKTIGEYQVRLTIDDLGGAALTFVKGEKTLKSAPKAIAKGETLLELKEAVKELKEQRRRAVESLERAMVESVQFPIDELRNILKSPMLRALVCKMIWTTGDTFGLIDAEKAVSDELYLADFDEKPLAPGETLRLAHPHDLRTRGVWAQWTRFFYDRKLVQPFKQVFREYYPMTQDELSAQTESRRYAGYQVNPKRAAALLKSRGWTVDYDEGLQRVFYQENLVARMFAAADWFTPSEVEAPTLETVEFFDRRTYRNVPFDNVPPILFSEIMRDIDLAVSVAHAGGVDPEASASTVEMRVAIAKELARLFKLENVDWYGSHAKIEGKLAKYSVHMGSGIVHAEGRGTIDIIAVQSQARGRIFLPFADDDPKTAEIMSKIVLLADDGKIKAPSILTQLRD